jgi:RHS repeat-associated protein
MYRLKDIYYLSLHDYEPYGSSLPGRGFETADLTNKYRFGFNGQEKENEINEGEYDFGARLYDSRICRWLSLDPLAAEFPSSSNYAFAINCPILFYDPDGEKPTKEAAALMALAAYGLGKELDPDYISAIRKLQSLGWVISNEEVTDLVEQKLRGYKAVLFVRRDENGNALEYDYEYAGTDDRIDVWNDITILFWSGQARKAASDAKTLNKHFGKDVELTFGGHSLGGALAKLAAKKTDRGAQTFNAAPTSILFNLLNGIINKSGDQIENYNNIYDPLALGRLFSAAANGITETFSKGYHSIKDVIGNMIDNWNKGSSKNPKSGSKTNPKGGKHKNDSGDSKNSSGNEKSE